MNPKQANRQRQIAMSVRLLLHGSYEVGASTGLCLSRRCARPRYPLGLTDCARHHRLRKGVLQGKWKCTFLVKAYVLCKTMKHIFLIKRSNLNIKKQFNTLLTCLNICKYERHSTCFQVINELFKTQIELNSID